MIPVAQSYWYCPNMGCSVTTIGSNQHLMDPSPTRCPTCGSYCIRSTHEFWVMCRIAVLTVAQRGHEQVIA